MATKKVQDLREGDLIVDAPGPIVQILPIPPNSYEIYYEGQDWPDEVPRGTDVEVVEPAPQETYFKLADDHSP